METLQFELRKKNILTSSFGFVFLSGLILIMIGAHITLYKIGRYDMINFEWSNIGVFFLFLYQLLYFYLEPFLGLFFIRKKWSANGKVTIPKKHISAIKNYGKMLIFQTTHDNYKIPTSFIIGNEFFENLPPESEESPKFIESRFDIVTATSLILSAIFFTLFLFSKIDDRLDLKYHLPFLRLETVKMEGKLVKGVSYSSKNELNFQLIRENDFITLGKFSGTKHLANKVLNLEKFNSIPDSTFVQIKVRKKELGVQYPGHGVWVYELKVNGEILLQKRGLKK